MRVERLRSRAQFEAVLAGPVVARTARFVLHRLEPAQVQAPLWPQVNSSMPAVGARAGARLVAWAGALVPKRWARRAVTRNVIRRQVHAVAGSACGLAAGCAYVVRLRSGFARAEFPSAASDALKRAVRGELMLLFSRAGTARRAA
ncbi:ribonuclease P protein component [Ottowia sp.]|uniref:ribonuclease P protein component n=1 Tax=Ottowia sp. TaxID=1898956 RepID=UPI002609F764|nr:ribonuclease P protein component [Ottowia sp.]